MLTNNHKLCKNGAKTGHQVNPVMKGLLGVFSLRNAQNECSSNILLYISSSDQPKLIPYYNALHPNIPTQMINQIIHLNIHCKDI